MKRNMIVGMVLVLAALAVAVFAAPSSGTIWATTWGKLPVRTDVINNLAGLAATQGKVEAPGLAVALANQADKAAADVAALYAVDTTQMTADELSAYADALTALNLALRNAANVCAQNGATDAATALNATLNSLLAYAQKQAELDSLFAGALSQKAIDAPAGGTLWGTIHEAGGGGGV